MKIVGCMPVRNEDWVLGISARVALMWCDALVILDHACDDRSRGIITDIKDKYLDRIGITTEVHNPWDEMRHRQDMLDVAREMGATHIAIIDADEVLTGNILPVQPAGANGVQSGVRMLIETMPAGHMLQLPGYNLRGGLDRYHSNGIWGKRWFSVVFRDDPRLCWQGDCFHHREPMGFALKPYKPIPQDNSGIMHLWGASERRLRAKHALYKVTERLRWPQKDIRQIDYQYSQWRDRNPADPSGPWQYNPVPAHWWAPYAHLQQYINVDAVPWQEAAVRDAVAKHGAATFRGLDLFGVA